MDRNEEDLENVKKRNELWGEKMADVQRLHFESKAY